LNLLSNGYKMDIFNRNEITQSIKQGKRMVFTFKYIGPDIIMMLNSVIAKVLSRMDHLFLLNSIVTIIREIVVNAEKANAKRVYFAKSNLDITNPHDYKIGMENFKNVIIGEFDLIADELNKSDYDVNIHILFKEKDVYVVVTNNSPILPEELERVQLRIQKAIQYNDFSEVYEDVDDDTEGAGLGIVLTILFLKNMGIDPKTFTIKSNGKVTQTTLFIPNELMPSSITSRFKDDIVQNIDGIPTFPENIVQLQRLCHEPDSSINEIADRIKKDPALSIDVIKLSNSAGFVTGKRIESVNQAVMTIGLKNVNAILTASNARRILDKRYANFEEIWEHCNKTAFYARHIGIMIKKSGYSENAFLAGLLHDLGKIILLSTNMDLVKRIAGTVNNRKIISSTIMEEISIGISHSTIGGLVAKKWNFPEYLQEAIAHHHSPLSTDKEHRILVSIVYLANMLCGIEDRRYTFFYLEEAILEKFGISDEAKFKVFHEKLKVKYKDMKEGLLD
jgi:HD-like signal output (HDOD) protein